MLSPVRKPWSETALRQFIARAIDKGWVREDPHSEFDRAYRNISADDIRFGLERSGWVLEKTEPAREKGRFKYTIRTTDIEGDELHLVLLPNNETATLAVITKY
jgi:hypothetical protein